MAQRWPLTGRVEELRYIATAARSGDGPRGVVIAGGAGVGKTRLAREAVHALGFSGRQVRWITGTSTAQSIPMGALLAQVGNSPFADVDDPNGPAVAVVDDAHLLDPISASLVHQLALRDAVIVVATVRTGEPAPDSVTALWKDGLLDRLELQPLNESVTARCWDQFSATRWIPCQCEGSGISPAAMHFCCGCWWMAKGPRGDCTVRRAVSGSGTDRRFSVRH